MSSISCRAPINPDLLRWARESLAICIEKAAKVASVSPDRYEKWESGVEQPTISKLRELANLYKRPLATFFMPEVPEEPPAPTDFRLNTPDGPALLSTKSRLAIRKAQWRQAVAKQLLDEIRYSRGFPGGIITLKKPAAQAAKALRELPFHTQLSWSDNWQALREWRLYLEGQGVFVFQESMPIKEIRGFSSLRDEHPPVIVINSKDTVNGRIFTLFHEYGHCLLNRGGVCNPSEVEFRDQKIDDIERYCNEFSGNFLVPADQIRSLMRDNDSSDVFELIHFLSNAFRVSTFVILRRLLALDIVDYKRYMHIYEVLVRQVRESTSSGGDYYRNKFAELGHAYIDLVVEAESSGLIPLSRALEFLGTKLKTIRKEKEPVPPHIERPYDTIVRMLTVMAHDLFH